MKPSYLLYCVLFMITTSFFTVVKAQVDVNDSLALVDLYNSTDGPGWTYKDNWLTKQPVKQWFGVTTKHNRVVTIYLPANDLHGYLPPSIGNLTALYEIELSSNSLTGFIPATIGNCSNLVILSLWENKLTGNIPASIGNLVNLDDLLLYNNQLSGIIPNTVGNLTKLYELALQHNQLSGTIPSSIGNLTKLNMLFLHDNQLSGIIPQSIGNLISLGSLMMDYNHLSGIMPAEIGNLPYLSFLSLSHNRLSGTIPSSFGNLVKLNGLLLNYNNLTGTIPSSIGNLALLYELYLNNNHLTGNVPSLRKLVNLNYLHLNNNQLIENNNPNLETNILRNIDINVSFNLFNFNSLEFVAQNVSKPIYSPQASIPIYQNNNTLSVNAGGTLSKNTYYWYKVREVNPTIIKGDSTFTPPSSGRYYAKVTNAVATKLMLYSDTITYTAPQQNDIASSATISSNHFSIYPSPATNSIHLQINGTATITLTNSAGTILLTKTVTNNGSINISHFANGTYYLQNKATGEAKKILIAH